MKRFNKYYLIICLLAFFSCDQSQYKLEKLSLERILQDSPVQGKLSSICDSVSYISLETNEFCFLSSRAHILFVDNEDILVSSDNIVYRFAIDGKFKNKIGLRGRGPEEYIRASSMSVDKKNNRLLFLVENNMVQYWSLDGDFIKKISLGESNEITAMQYSNGYMFCESRQYEQNVSIDVCLFDDEGNMIFKRPVYSDDKNVNRILQTMPIMYPYGNGVKYFNRYEDKIYLIGKDSTCTLDIDLELNHLLPDREIVEDVNRKKELLDMYVQILDIKESKNYLIFALYYKNDSWAIIYDKVNSLVLYYDQMTHPRKGGGIENDISNIGNFWPSFITVDSIGGLLYPEILSTSEMATINDLKQNSIPVNDDSNPVVVLCHLK